MQLRTITKEPVITWEHSFKLLKPQLVQVTSANPKWLVEQTNEHKNRQNRKPPNKTEKAHP